MLHVRPALFFVGFLSVCSLWPFSFFPVACLLYFFMDHFTWVVCCSFIPVLNHLVSFLDVFVNHFDFTDGHHQFPFSSSSSFYPIRTTEMAGRIGRDIKHSSE